MYNHDPWLLRPDGVIDPVALAVASTGARQVALTRRERDISALIIRYDYKQRCLRDGAVYDAEALAELVWHHLSLRSLRVAHSLIGALPSGRAARGLVNYWTRETFRESELARRARARQLVP